MKNETIAVLEKNKPDSLRAGKDTPKEPKSPTGCCGGAPSLNEEACCKLDEEKKAEGSSGCGCNTTAKTDSSLLCC